jgi:DHA1 family bicyclomycin/chloramphenicol resistance-like MFS transporter
MRLGMRRISNMSMLWFAGAAALHALVAVFVGDIFWLFMLLLALTFSVFGLMSSNFNALAMTPMGHVAGSASALFGAITASGGALLGALNARAIDGTTAPYLIGVTLAALCVLATVWITERGKLALSAPP